jgi:hypothetical protein
MFFRVMRFLVVLLVLVVGSAVNAAPTVSNFNSITGNIDLLPNTDIKVPVATNVTLLVEYGDSTFAEVAADFLNAPAGSAALVTSPYSHSKNLPAVPGTILMVLSGFLCISLVKDRKVWLAALAGLLWAGQTGIQLVPQLALCFRYSNNSEQRPCTEISRLYYHKNSPRLRSDIEGTQYIGLLRHLAGIPRSYGCNIPVLKAVAARELSSLNSQIKCLSGRTPPVIYFSPAFIFNNLARSPPELA